jgi:catechol 2,3-dioxygenase-like lactoylglutathione lyase family enzyme
MALDHVSIGVTNVERAKAFYDAVLAPLHMAPVMPVEIAGRLVGVGYGETGKPSFWIQLPSNGQPASMGNGVHVAYLFQGSSIFGFRRCSTRTRPMSWLRRWCRRARAGKE